MTIKKLGTQLKIASDTITLDIDKAIDPSSDKKVIEKKDAEFLYFRARAISAGDQGPEGLPNPNGNGDYFPRKELESSYETFVGRNLFLNHDADHPIKSIGKIIDAYEVEDPETGEYYIETLSKIDRKLHPEIARKVETSELNTVSMGCSCEASMCSICGTTIHTDNDEKCAHLEPTGILKQYTAEVDLPEYGIEKGRPATAFSINSGLVFNELSIVNVPADADAFIKGVIASNIKKKLTKKASLDATELKHFNVLFANLDNKSQKCLTDQICSRALPKEETKMSNKESDKNKGENIIEDLQKNMNAFDYMRLEEHIMKKNQKASESKAINTQIKKSDSVIDKAINAVKKSPLGRIFEKAVKKEIEKARTPKTAQKEITAKFVKADNFVDSHWSIFEGDKEVLKAPVKNLWDEKTLKSEKYQNWIKSEGYKNKLVEKYSQVGVEKLAKILNVAGETKHLPNSKVEKPSKSEFAKDGSETKADKELDKSYKAFNKEDEKEVGSHNKEHEEAVKEASKKTAEHKPDCECPICKNTKKDSSDDKKEDKDDKKEEKKEDKKEEKSDDKKEDKKDDKEDKDDKKEEKSDDKEEKDEDKKEDKEASESKEDLKKEADESVIEDPEVHEEALDHEPSTDPTEEPTPELKDEPTVDEVHEKHQSAFDVLDKPLKINDAYEAEKDKETNEIVVKDVDGNEVKRLDDGFGDDVAKVLKLLKDILGIEEENVEEKEPNEESVDEPKAPAENEAMEEPATDDPVDDSFMASKKEKLTKEAEENFKKKAEELAKKEAEVEARQRKLNAEKFAAALAAKTKKCQALAEEMFKKDLIKYDEADFEVAKKSGKGILDARKKANEIALRREYKKLLALSADELQKKEAEVAKKQIKKEASNRLSSPLYTNPFTPKGDEDVIDDIFGSMGNGGGVNNFQ